MGSAVVSTAPVGVPPTGRQRSAQLTNAPNSEWNLLHHLFGETPNRATGTVALPVVNCIVGLVHRFLTMLLRVHSKSQTFENAAWYSTVPPWRLADPRSSSTSIHEVSGTSNGQWTPCD